MMKNKDIVQIAFKGFFCAFIFFSISCRDKKHNYYVAYVDHVSKQIENKSSFKFIRIGEQGLGLNTDSILISNRDYLSDGSFVDYNILGSNDTALVCSINFKAKDGNWYIYDGAKWQTFYSNGKLHDVELLYSNKIIIPEKRYILDGQELLSFEWKEKDVIYTSGAARCFFSPARGVVIIGDHPYIRREDYSPVGLDSLMNEL